MTKTARRFLASGIAAAFTAVCTAAALLFPGAFFSVYPAVSRAIQRPLAAFSARFPFALWEALLLLAVLWAVVSLILAVRRGKKLQWLAGLICALVIGAGAFTCIWGLNHLGPTLGEKLGLEVSSYTKEELVETAVYYLKQANAAAGWVERNADGTVAMPEFDALTAAAPAGYLTLAEEYKTFRGALQPAKKVAAWPLMSRFGVTGIFICLTGESSVNPDTYPASLPFTLCHELAHRMAIAAEDEANFAAYLTCRANPDPYFQYSAAYSAFIYCYNSLYDVSPRTAQALWEYADEGLIADCRAASVHYEQYEGKVQDAAQKVNDAYLKVFSEPSGVQSYGEVTDYLIALYFAEKNT